MRDECDLSQPVLTRIVRGLVTDGLVETLGKAESTGGRRPVLLGLRADSCRVLGVRLDRGEMELLEVDLCGTEVRRSSVPWSGRRLDIADVASVAARACRVSSRSAPLVGVNVAAPG